jgi:hypothetical protein
MIVVSGEELATSICLIIASMMNFLNTLYRSRVLRYSLLIIVVVIAACWLLIMTWGIHYVKQSIEDYSTKIGYRIEYRDLRIAPLQLRLELDEIKLSSRDANAIPLFTLRRGVLQLDLPSILAGRIGIREIQLTDPQFHVERRVQSGKPGLWNWQSFVAAVSKVLPPKDPASPPKQIEIEQFGISGLTLSLNDQPNRYRHDFGPIGLELRDLANFSKQGKQGTLEGDYQIDLGKLDIRLPNSTQRIQVGRAQLAGGVRAGEGDLLAIDLAATLDSGKVTSRWLLGAASNTLSGDIQLEQLSLIPLMPFLPSNKPLVMQSGVLNGSLQFDSESSAWSIKGDLLVPDLFVRESNVTAPLLAWKEAKAEQLQFKKFNDGRSHLSVHELLLLQPQIQYEINEKGFSNFRRLFMKGGDSEAPVTEAPAKTEEQGKAPEEKNPSPTAATKEPSLFTLDLRSVQLRDASLLFTDLAIKPKVQVAIRKLKGSLLGISNEPGHFASVALDGLVAESGNMRATGQMAFDDPRLNHDIQLQFRNLPLSDSNPYFMAFAGRHILGGRLDLTLNYKSAQGQLNGQNRFVIKKIELGEEVPEFTGKRLPLGLAVALLEDSDDVIDVKIDIAGNVNSPEFSAAGLVWQAVRTVLTNVVTAPFRALASLLGMQGDPAIYAIPGEAAFLPSDQERFTQFSDLLVKRPHATMELIGTYDPELDRQELARARADRAILTASGFKLEASAPLPMPSLSDKRIQAGIKSAYAAEIGRIKLTQRILTLPDNTERYQQLRQELITQFAVSDAQLQALGDARARLAQEVMMKSHPALGERIRLGAPKAVTGQREGIPLEIALGAK